MELLLSLCHSRHLLVAAWSAGALPMLRAPLCSSRCSTTPSQSITVPPGQLTLHADRGGPMKAKATALLLADLGVTRSHNRPHTSNDNPFSESHFKTLKYQPQFPQRFGCIEDVRCFCCHFFDWYRSGPSPCRYRSDDARRSALLPGRCRSHRSPTHARSGVPRQPGALRQQAADTAGKAAPPPGSTHQCRKAAPEMPTPTRLNPRNVSCSFPLASFSAIAASTRHLTRVSWTRLTLSSETNAFRDTHGDGATFNRPGSARSARKSLPPDYDTAPKPAVQCQA